MEIICFRNNVDVNPVEETLLCSPENLNKSLYFLNRALSWENIPKMLTFECFLMLKENSDNVETDWSHAIPISSGEFKAQIHYDLGTFFFYKENYKLATTHFVQCKQFLDAVKGDSGLITIDKDDLEGYLLACMGGSKKNLLHQLRNSVASQYTVKNTLFFQSRQYLVYFLGNYWYFTTRQFMQRNTVF